MKELIEALNNMLDGIAGHLMEQGDVSRYWNEKEVAQAISTLKKHDPKASSLEYFEEV